MADHGRYDTEERRPRSEHRGHGGSSIFVSSWRGSGSGSREERGRREERGDRGDRGGWFGDGRTSDRDRSERSRERDDRWSRHGGDRERSERDFGYDDRHEGLPIEETGRLIASNKVEGTPVYSRDGDRLGTIYNFMVDKRSGQVEYAVMSYGGFLGMGQRYYPLPWRVLAYHTDTGGYVIDMSERDFRDAPSFDRNDEPEFDRHYGRKVHSWYGLDY